MIAAALALTLAAAQAAAPADAPPSNGVANEAEDAASLETLRQVYQTSCADRDFYTYSDVCEQLRHQVRAAEAAAARAARRPATKPKPVNRPAPRRPGGEPEPSGG